MDPQLSKHLTTLEMHSEGFWFIFDLSETQKLWSEANSIAAK